MKDTQTERILQYMQDYGSITQMDALREFGCMRLASRISDLKRKGYGIEKTQIAGVNRYGETTHYASYSLAQVEEKNGPATI